MNIILNLIFLLVTASIGESLHAREVCVGHNYEQQNPTQRTTSLSVLFTTAISVVKEGQATRLTADATVDAQGKAFYYWCTDKGSFTKITDDYKTVLFVPPASTGNDVANMWVKVGDSLGYIAYATTTVAIEKQLAYPTLQDTNGLVQFTFNSPTLGTGIVKINNNPVDASWSANGVSFNLFQATQTTAQTQKAIQLSITDSNGKVLYDACYPFVDVCPNRWFSAPVMKLWKEKVVQGYDNGKSGIFAPYNIATRSEGLAMILRASVPSLTFNQPTVKPFDDVALDAWYAALVQYAKDNGLVEGCNIAKTRFCPDDSLSRAAAFKMLALAFPKYKTALAQYQNGQTCDLPYKDVSPTAWYYPYVCAVRDTLGGYRDQTLRPNDFMSRAEAARLVCIATYGAAACIESGSDKVEIPPTLPKVTSVSPLAATLGQLLKISVIGENLPDTTALWIANCVNVVATGGTAQKRDFECTPSNDQVGSQEGVVKDKPDGTILSNFNVNVSKTITGCTTPTVSSVSPLKATLNQNTTFTVNGSCLSGVTAFFIPECANLTSLGGSETQRQFQCTPSYTTGIKDGVVKDKSGGTVLLSFNVDVSEIVATCTTPTVSSVSPLQVTLDEPATFTVNGSCLTDTTAFWIDACASPNASSIGTLFPMAGGSATQRKFQCTPSYSTGSKQGVVKDQSAGTVLSNFSVNVIAGTPKVTAVSPLTAKLNQSTTFTVTGSNLPDTTAFFIPECANLVNSGGSTTERKFQCTPSYTTGSKSGVVKDKSGGSTLYSFNVAVQ